MVEGSSVSRTRDSDFSIEMCLHEQPGSVSDRRNLTLGMGGLTFEQVLARAKAINLTKEMFGEANFWIPHGHPKTWPCIFSIFLAMSGWHSLEQSAAASCIVQVGCQQLGGDA